jgi:hypothetical protein
VEGDFGDLGFSGLSVDLELDSVELEGCIGWNWEKIRGELNSWGINFC